MLDHEVRDKPKVTKIDLVRELFKRNNDARSAIGKPLVLDKEDQEVANPIKPQTEVKNCGTSEGPKEGPDKGKRAQMYWILWLAKRELKILKLILSLKGKLRNVFMESKLLMIFSPMIKRRWLLCSTAESHDRPWMELPRAWEPSDS